jgi:hypothetical protein
MKSKMYLQRQKNIIIKRLIIARGWVWVVIFYYILRAVLIIFPDMKKNDNANDTMEVIYTAIELFQLLICLLIVGVVITTYQEGE